MWEFLNNILAIGGLPALISILTLGILYKHVREDEKREEATLDHIKVTSAEVKEAHVELLALYEKRLQDIRDERERYEELSKDLDKSLKLVIEVFREKS